MDMDIESVTLDAGSIGAFPSAPGPVISIGTGSTGRRRRGSSLRRTGTLSLECWRERIIEDDYSPEDVYNSPWHITGQVNQDRVCSSGRNLMHCSNFKQ